MSYNRKSSVLSIEAITESSQMNSKLKSEQLGYKAEQKHFTKLQIIKNLTIISLTFMLIFTAYDGISMLQSTMNGEKSVGNMSQAVAFLSFGFTSLLLPKYVIKKIGCRLGILLATSLFWPYQAANFYPAWITLIPSGIMIGVGASLIWATKSTYFNKCALIYVLLTKESNAQSKNKKKNIAWIDSTAHLTSTKEMEDPNKRPDQFDTLHKYDIEPYEKKLPEQCGTVKTVSKEMANILNTDQNRDKDTLPEFFTKMSNSPSIVNGSTEMCLKQIELPGPTSNEKPEVKSLNNTHDANSSYTSSGISDIERITALFFGFHGMVYSISQIWSNLMTYYILNMSAHSETITTNLQCGAAYCEADSSNFSSNDSEVSLEARNLLSTITVALSLMAILVVLLFLDSLNDDKEHITFSFDMLLATLKHCKKKEQFFLIPLSIFIGMSQGFYTADFTKSFVSCAWSTAHVGLVTVSYGVFSGLTSIVSGYLVKYLGRVPIMVCTQVINIGAHVFLLMWDPDTNHTTLFFLGAALWGGIVGVYWTMAQSFIGIVSRKEEEAAFAGFYLWSSIGWCISFVISDYTCTYIKLYLSLAVSTIGIVGYLIIERDFKLKRVNFEM